MKRRFLIAALLLGIAAPAIAQPERGDTGAGPPANSAGRQIPLSRVLAMLAQRTPGRHLNTTLGESGGRPAYYVQWQRAKDGHVVVFVVDAESGQIVGQQGG
jgi:uncharacterized membrane protein YkoI